MAWKYTDSLSRVQTSCCGEAAYKYLILNTMKQSACMLQGSVWSRLC